MPLPICILSQKGISPLFLACRKNRHAVVQYFLSQKEYLTFIPGLNPDYDPVLFCVKNGNLEMIKLLIARNLDLTIRNKDGKNALTYAIQLNRIEIIRSIIERVGSVDVRDKDSGETPFISACLMDKFEIAGELLQMGANPHIRNAQGKNLYEIAQTQNNAKILNFFKTKNILPTVYKPRRSFSMRANGMGGANKMQEISLLKTVLMKIEKNNEEKKIEEQTDSEIESNLTGKNDETETDNPSESFTPDSRETENENAETVLNQRKESR